MHLRLVGHQFRQSQAEPDRFGRQLGTSAVALVEDQVDDGEHCGEPVWKQMRGRHAERNPGCLDLALRPHEPLRHRRLRHEERPRDLVRRQAAERSQRQRDLRVERERGMAAREDELEPLVTDRRVVQLVLHGFRHLQQAGLGGERAIAPNAVDRPVACCRHEPHARAVGHAFARPALGRDRERLLGGFLGEVEVAEEADQRRNDAAPFVAEDLFDDP